MTRIALTALAATLLLAGAADAQQRDFSQVQIKTTDLGNANYMLEGQGGNIAVAVGSEGIIMVDSEFAGLHDKIKAAIGAISDQPIRYLIDTHYHGEQTGGNEAFHQDGAVIVAQDNVRVRMAAGTRLLQRQQGFAGAGRRAPDQHLFRRHQVGASRRSARTAHACHQCTY